MLFVVALENVEDKINFWEAIFMLYALGFSLEKIAAMQEHGIKGQSLYIARYCGKLLTIPSRRQCTPRVPGSVHLRRAR